MEENKIFYLCSLIESVSRVTGQSKGDIVNQLGAKEIKNIYDYANVNHCLPLNQVTEEVIENNEIKTNNVRSLNKKTSAWDLGKVYCRLIIDISSNNNWIDKLIEVYNSWICEYLDNEDLPIYWQSRSYIKECYLQSKILD